MQTTNMLVRSSEQTNRAESIVVSEPDQVSAAHYRFRLEGKRMFGRLVSSQVLGRSELSARREDDELRKELAIWDSLSDEALLTFEDSLD